MRTSTVKKLTAKQVKKQGAVVIGMFGSVRHYVIKTTGGYKFLAVNGSEVIATLSESTFVKLNKHFVGGLEFQH